MEKRWRLEKTHVNVRNLPVDGLFVAQISWQFAA
jgi:hypothetical protein|tara:strand:+ start:15200 stop:15301 length:102 start_codon:yes stop_codon:yes gene_type:complete